MSSDPIWGRNWGGTVQDEWNKWVLPPDAPKPKPGDVVYWGENERLRQESIAYLQEIQDRMIEAIKKHTNKQEAEGETMKTFTFKINGQQFSVQEDAVMLPLSRVAEVFGCPEETFYVKDPAFATRLIELDPEKDFVFSGVDYAFYVK